jgi:hypothetical protein
MSDNQNNQQKHECKCEGSKEMKTLKKQVDDLYAMLLTLTKEVETLRKAVRK